MTARPSASDPAAASRRQRLAWVGVVTALAALHLFELVQTAWLSDDAYITFRVVRNLLDGFGPRFNLAERVQVYTHPLWMLALAAANGLSGEPYFSTLALSIVLSLASVVLLGLALPRNAAGAALVLAIAVSSRSLVDYGTSGLENPLAHLLLVSFLAVAFRPEPSDRRALVLVLLASAVMIDRMDQVLLVGPVLLVELARPVSRVRLGAFAIGLLPFLGWELFSLVYYGFPFPNTAYAKLGSGIGGAALARQGGWYLLDLVRGDPVTAVAIVAGACAGLVRGNRVSRGVSVGVILYLAYIVKIGGDFMSGRFFTGPLVVALALLGRLELGSMRARAVAAGGLAVLLASSPVHPWTSGMAYGLDTINRVWPHGIADERAVYYPYTGLLRAEAEGSPSRITHPWVDAALRARKAGGSVVVFGNVGLFGYFAGPEVHCIDQPALADPLLARLPAAPAASWRIGHFNRAVPEGYVETLTSGANVIRDPGIHAYYDELRSIVRDPVFDPARLMRVVRMNLGRYDTLLRPGSSSVSSRAEREPLVSAGRGGDPVGEPLLGKERELPAP